MVAKSNRGKTLSNRSSLKSHRHTRGEEAEGGARDPKRGQHQAETDEGWGESGPNGGPGQTKQKLHWKCGKPRLEDHNESDLAAPAQGAHKGPGVSNSSTEVKAAHRKNTCWFRSVAVIMKALHAVGLGFEPHWNHNLWDGRVVSTTTRRYWVQSPNHTKGVGFLHHRARSSFQKVK